MKSRFLNVSPRAYIRQKDSRNIIPPIVRTGYQNEIGFEENPFSENDNTQIFKEKRVLLAPYMVPANIASDSGFLTGSLFLTGVLKPGSAYLDKKISSDPVRSFKEGPNPAAYKEGDYVGFPEELYPGFSSHDADKTAIVFNIGTTTDFDVIKIKESDSNLDPLGPFFGKSGSGFLYYDHVLKKWIDVGTRDPSTGAKLDYNPVFDLDDVNAFTATSENIIASGSDKFLCQFSSSPYSAISEGTNYIPKSKEDLCRRGYDKIGEPTAFFGAPFSPRYHATTGSSFSLSNLITEPFIVDRISVNIPVRFYRTQDPPSSPGPGMTDDGFGRDIDNHVFFIYVQNRSNVTKDTRQDVSSSIRYLVAKQSFCAFNEKTLDKVSNGLKPFHSLGSATEFKMVSNIASSSKKAIVEFQDVELNMTFRPTTFISSFGTTSKLAGRAYTATGPSIMTGSVFVQNFWPGGQYASGSASGITIPSKGTGQYRNINQRLGAIPPRIQDYFCNPSPRSIISSFWDGTSKIVSTGSGLGEPGYELDTCTVGPILGIAPSNSKQTPIVLFPGDEIIFGIDSGANSNMISPGRTNTGLDKTIMSATGSRVVIRSGDANVILYGTTVTNNQEHLPSLNQHLGSDAIHEDIHESGPYDQFDILDKSVLSASYVDGIFSGEMLSGTRKRTALSTSNAINFSGFLQRNVKHINQDLLYYDSFVPVPPAIVSGIQNATKGKLPTVVITKDATNGFAFENNRAANTLLDRDFTYEFKATDRARNLTLQLIDPSIPTTSILKEDNSRFALFYNGINSTITYPPAVVINKGSYSGATSIRYGLINVRLCSPSYVFSRNSFGQFRDLVEQAKQTRFVSTVTGKDVVGPSAVVATFVSASTDTPISPESTQCSNVSQFCTSSVPFCDDDNVRNRGDLPPLQTIKFGTNNLVFGVDKDTNVIQNNVITSV